MGSAELVIEVSEPVKPVIVPWLRTAAGSPTPSTVFAVEGVSDLVSAGTGCTRQ
jgi:hypothetical protein